MVNVNPRIDLVFKKIFGIEENKDLTISLINSIVGPQDQVKDLTILNPYNPQHFMNDKLSILDIKAEGHDGKRFNIEIQVSDEGDYDKRALYYWAKIYTEQLAEGEDYSRLSKAIGIHLLWFTSIPQSHKYHNVFHIREKDQGFKYFQDMELHTIELAKFEKDLPKDLKEVTSQMKGGLDIWSSFLTRHDLLQGKELSPPLNTPEVKKALSILDHLNFTKEERDAYEDRLKWYRIEMNTLKNQFLKGKAVGRAEGKQEGLREGEHRGLAKGRDEGRAEGKEEGLEEGRAEGIVEGKTGIIRAMKNYGLSIEEISKITGIKEETIREQSKE